ncbi:microtubule associated protein spm2 [Cystoisospora suis]|uniref:Microtubule associated protein spm2 n=1 Tax=Cystoisospora suis TaxID=483139 RepID=A0A2C6L0N4_9APIC|nr:microtubule associated protein spm2 [Cystoisospora suis]
MAASAVASSPGTPDRVMGGGVQAGRAAGVSSNRLSELRLGPMLHAADRVRGTERPSLGTRFAPVAAVRDSVTEILRPGVSYENYPAPVSQPTDPAGAFAGMDSEGINELREPANRRRHIPFRKRGVLASNESIFVSDVLGQHGRPPDAFEQGVDPRVKAYFLEQQKPRVRNLQTYCDSNELNKAFRTKMEVVDKTTGRTEIMTARRPGSAAAVVSLSDFDAYGVRKDRTVSAYRQMDSIENTALGLMPREGTESMYRTSVTRTAHGMRCQRGQLRCQDSWLAPAEDAPTMRHLGESKRHSVFPWLRKRTDNFLCHLSASPVRRTADMYRGASPYPVTPTTEEQEIAYRQRLADDARYQQEQHQRQEKAPEQVRARAAATPEEQFENAADFEFRQRSRRTHEYGEGLLNYAHARREAQEVGRQQRIADQRNYQEQLRRQEMQRQVQEEQDQAIDRLQRQYYEDQFEKPPPPEYPFTREPHWAGGEGHHGGADGPCKQNDRPYYPEEKHVQFPEYPQPH